jgi:hypothetical protein
MTSTLFRKVLFHGFFLLVIGGLVVWIRYERSRRLDDAALRSVGVTMASVSKLVARNGSSSINSINKGADAYKTDQNESYRQLAIQFSRMVDTANMQIANLREGLKGQGGSLSSLRKSLQMPDWTAIAQKLTGLPGIDSTTKSDIRICLFDADIPNPPAWWTVLMKRGSSELAQAFLDYQTLRLNLALDLAESYIYHEKIEEYSFWKDLSYDLQLIPLDEALPHLQVPFKAEVMLKRYSKAASNVQTFINAKPVSMQDGKALYRTEFGSSGNQKIKVEIRVHNPLTGEIRTYAKDFNLHVLPICVPSK